MGDEFNKSRPGSIDVAEAARDMAEIARLAAKYNLIVSAAPLPSAPPPIPAPQELPTVEYPSAPEVPGLASAKAPRVFIASFDGTFGGLIGRYFTDEQSPFRKLKHSVGQNYRVDFKRIEREFGSDLIANWDAKRIQSQYDDNWAADGKIQMANLLIGKLRLLLNYGSAALNDEACMRLSSILRNMRFRVPEKGDKREVLTIEQVREIRAAAHTFFNWPSIALAQALMLEIPWLRQVDILGEWVPMSDRSASAIINENKEKWVHGLRWQDIDENNVLRWTITPSRKNSKPKQYELRLKTRPGVMEEINRVPMEKRVGPLIVCEATGLPWAASAFRRKWRLVADRVGVSPNLTCTDGAYFTNKAHGESESRAETL